MRFLSHKLRILFDLILHDTRIKDINLEISTDVEYLTIAVNYGDSYYISYVSNISNSMESYFEDGTSIVLNYESLNKLNQMVNLWPLACIEILQKQNCLSMEIVNYGKLQIERPVLVECKFKLSTSDYQINAPTMWYNCIVNAQNLKQMLEFCAEYQGVTICINDKLLHITNISQTIGTRVELEEIREIPTKEIKLSAEANNLIVSFLTRLITKYNLVYLLFIEPENAFSIKVKLDDLTYVQLYAIHD